MIETKFKLKLRKIILSQLVILLGLLPNLVAYGQKPSPSGAVPRGPDLNLGPPASFGAPVVNAMPLPTGVRSHIREVSLDEVLAWRKAYDDLLGKDFALTEKRFGPLKTEQGGVIHSAVSVNNRRVEFSGEQNKLSVVTVYPRDEDVAVVRVLVKAPVFCFRSGSWTGTGSGDFFEARSRDGRNILQFAISPYGIRLMRVVFLDSDTAKPCDPGRVAPTMEEAKPQ